MDEAILKSKIEECVINHIKGVEEIFQLEDVAEISNKYELDAVGIITALTAKIALSSGMTSISEKAIIEVTSMIEKFAISQNVHPIDSCYMLLKILSDILMQITIIEQDCENLINEVE